MRDHYSMSEAARQLLDEFEALPESEQKSVAAEILLRTAEWDVPSPVDAEADALTDEQREEIDRRLAEHAQDPDSAIPWEEGRLRLYRRFA